MKLYLYDQLRSRPFFLTPNNKAIAHSPFTTTKRSPNLLLSAIAALSTS
ncbi:MAG: hypothetical protein AB1861_24910 [Cyanobacteriota bacterium]